MGLTYKADWEAARERLRRWWQHEYFGRCALAVTAPRDNPRERPAPPAPKTVQERWYDLDAIAARNEYTFSRTFYGGEAIPMWHAGYPGIAACNAAPTGRSVGGGCGVRDAEMRWRRLEAFTSTGSGTPL